MFKNIDRFGVELPLRIKNYEKFTTNTGGVIFLLYLIGIFSYFTYNITDYFTNPRLEERLFEKDFYQDEVNLKEQNFYFAIYDFEKSIRYNHKILKSYYSYDYKLTNIPEKICQEDEFNFEGNLDYKNPDLICFDNKTNETISGDSYPRKQIKYQIFPGTNKTKTKEKIRIVYSINTFDSRDGAVLGFNNIYFEDEFHQSYNIYLEKSVYLYDFGIFYENPKEVVITNFNRYAILTTPRNSSDDNSPLITISLKQTNTVNVIKITRKRLYVVILEMISMATTLLSNIRAIVIILNRKKAKQNIFETIFHINSFEKDNINIPNEIEIQKIPNENNIKDLSEMRNLQVINEDKNDDLFPKNEIISLDIEPIEKRMERIQEILNRNKIERIQREFHGRSNEIDDRNNLNPHNNNDLIELSINENIKKDENDTKEKINMILKNYPTIKNKHGYKKDPRTVRNIFSYLYLILTCKRKRLKQVNSLTDIIDREFAESMNVYNFIKREKNLIVIENILFNQEEKILLDFISMPLINLEKEKELEKKPLLKLDNYEDILIYYNNLQRKQNKTEIEKKLIDSFKNKMKNN